MNRQEHLLTILKEECAELIQATSKTARFSINSNYDNGVNNAEQMQKEFNDVLAMVEMINEDYGFQLFGTDFELIKAKKEKVEEYLLYSKKCGTLTT